MSKKLFFIFCLLMLALALAGCGKKSLDPVPEALQNNIDNRATLVNEVNGKKEVAVIASAAVPSEKGHVVLASMPNPRGGMADSYFIFDEDSKQVATVFGKQPYSTSTDYIKLFKFIEQPDSKLEFTIVFEDDILSGDKNEGEFWGATKHVMPIYLLVTYNKGKDMQVKGYFTGQGQSPKRYHDRVTDEMHLKLLTIFAKALPTIHEQLPDGYLAPNQ